MSRKDNLFLTPSIKFFFKVFPAAYHNKQPLTHIRPFFFFLVNPFSLLVGTAKYSIALDML